MNNYYNSLPALFARFATINTVENVQNRANSKKIYLRIILSKEILKKILILLTYFYYSNAYSANKLEWHGKKIDNISLSGFLNGFFFYLSSVQYRELKQILFRLYDFLYSDNTDYRNDAVSFFSSLLNKTINANLQSSSSIDKLNDVLEMFGEQNLNEIRLEFFIKSNESDYNIINKLVSDRRYNEETANLSSSYDLRYNELRNLDEYEEDRTINMERYNDLLLRRLENTVSQDDVMSDLEKSLDEQNILNQLGIRKKGLMTRSQFNLLSNLYSKNPALRVTTQAGREWENTRKYFEALKRPSPSKKKNNDLIAVLRNIDNIENDNTNETDINTPNTSRYFASRGKGILSSYDFIRKKFQ